MPARRRTGLWVSAVLGIAVVAGVTAFVVNVKGRFTAIAVAAVDESTPLADLSRAVRGGDSKALALMFQRTALKEGERPQAVDAAEAAEWVDAFSALRSSFLQFNSYGRSSAMIVVGRVLQRLAVEPAPANWVEAMRPASDVVAAGLNDGHLDVRVTALTEVSRLWRWSPGRTMLKAEEDLLGDWKQTFHTPVLRRLGDAEPKARAAAVACLGELPIDSAAAPALAYLDDPKSPEVRQQVLVSFARRPSLLTEDAILKHMFDREASIPEAAEIVLQTRGLTREQISLGSMIFHPKAEIRASVIPLLKNRTDVDPAVWLLQLTHDTDEAVRLGAVDALAARLSPEVGARLAEMAAKDRSPAVRQAAGRILPEIAKTAALPPLPGSPSLYPRAN